MLNRQVGETESIYVLRVFAKDLYKKIIFLQCDELALQANTISCLFNISWNKAISR